MSLPPSEQTQVSGAMIVANDYQFSESSDEEEETNTQTTTKQPAYDEFPASNFRHAATGVGTLETEQPTSEFQEDTCRSESLESVVLNEITLDKLLQRVPQLAWRQALDSMIMRLIRRENDEIVSGKEDLAVHIFKIFTEATPILSATKDVADMGRLVKDSIVETFTQQLYLLSLSLLQNRRFKGDSTAYHKFQNIMQAYIETAEKIVDHVSVKKEWKVSTENFHRNFHNFIFLSSLYLENFCLKTEIHSKLFIMQH